MKYCNEYVCLYVCLSTSISPEPQERSLPILCMLPIAVGQSSSSGGDEIPWEGSVFEVFFPIDNAL